MRKILVRRTVVAAAVAVGVFLFGACGQVDSAVTREARMSIEDKAEMVPNESRSRVPLTECPLTAETEAVTRLVTELTTLLVEDGTLDAPIESGLFRPEVDAEVQVACDQFDGGESIVGVGVYAQRAVGDLATYISQISGGAEGAEVSVMASGVHRGGQFHHVCVRFPGELEQYSYCEVDWMDQNLLVGAYVAGQRSDQLNLAVLEDSLTDHVIPIAESLAAWS